MKLFFSLAASAMPGFLRVYLVWLLALLFTPEQSASLTAEFLLATALCMFTGGGFGLVLLRQVANASRQSQILTTCSLLVAGIVVSALIGWIAARILQSDTLNVVLLVVALSTWQIERYGWIAHRKFIWLCGFDILLILSITFAAVFTPLDIVTNLLLCHVFCTVFSLIARTYTWSSSGSEIRISSRLILNGLQMGTTNFISGGFLFVLPSLLEATLTAVILAKLNLAVTAIGALFIIPRSYLNLFMGTLARLAHRQKLHIEWVATCMKRVRRIGLVMIIPAIAFVLFYMVISGYKVQISDIILATLICAAMVSGQLYLVESNLLMLLKRENVTLIASLVMFAFMTGISLALAHIGFTDYSLLFLVFICLALAYVCRWVFFSKILSRYLKPRVSGA